MPDTTPTIDLSPAEAAAKQGPSGANAQSWQVIVVRDTDLNSKIAEHFIEGHRFRVKAKMTFSPPD